MDFFFEEESDSNPNQNEGRDKDPRMLQVENAEAILSRDDDVEENFSSNDISRRVQELVEKIHDRRTNDQKEIESFQQIIVDKVTEVCQQMKQDMYNVYEENSSEMQVKLLELTDVLETCTRLHTELLKASHVLASLQEGLTVSCTAEPMSE
ncbi:synaptonemal complex central element protein 2 [Phyllopteryx taeniolatus]|uniref:synaptonemal complex central element protein 2 n=1 Tax=Phyllopteryx taeniolatus TaxID=161469 RepID=UPI002AD2BA7E|nr:synaptonemal complex central element protein 2 [Phyllopteryx taeniolatus]XP_061625665.1 synaptonemal complex central element protein 2 [Phyllopteryx taeniolatus]XP_061625666.1 synaptonemal complex central element protein 2 [Phyllopteryx taeniolatus]